MANFNAKVRIDYRDVDGLVLDCRPDGMVNDGSDRVERWNNVAPSARALFLGSHDGANNVSTLTDTSKTWRVNEHVGKVAMNLTDGSDGLITANTANTVTASLSGGTDDDWDTGDEYALTTFRFGDPVQSTDANKPSIVNPGGYYAASFDRSASQNLLVPATYPVIESLFTTAIDYVPGSDTTANQSFFGTANYQLQTRNASGFVSYSHNATDVAGTAAMDAGVWVFGALGTSTANVFNDGVVDYSGSFSPIDVAAGTSAAAIGSLAAGSNYLDGLIRHIAMWDRPISTNEKDFVFNSFSEAASHSVNDYSTMLIRTWTDETGTATEPSRINPTVYAGQRYKLANFTGSGNDRVQLVASVDGIVKPDADLGGELFTWDVVEFPGTAPTVHLESGFSALADVEINVEGHYTFQVFRENGGSIFLHLDAEEI